MVRLKLCKTNSSNELETLRRTVKNIWSPERWRNSVDERTEESIDLVNNTGTTKLNQSYDPGLRCLCRSSRKRTLSTERGRNYTNRLLDKVFDRRRTQIRYNIMGMPGNCLGRTASTSISGRNQIHRKERSRFSQEDPESHRKYKQTGALEFATLRIRVWRSL